MRASRTSGRALRKNTGRSKISYFFKVVTKLILINFPAWLLLMARFKLPSETMKYGYVDRYGDELVLYHSTHFDAFRQIVSSCAIRTSREVDWRELPEIRHAGSFRELMETARRLSNDPKIFYRVGGPTNIYFADDPWTARHRSPYPSHVIFELHLPENWIRVNLIGEFETVEGIKRIPLSRALRIISRSNYVERTKEVLSGSKRFNSISVVEIPFYS